MQVLFISSNIRFLEGKHSILTEVYGKLLSCLFYPQGICKKKTTGSKLSVKLKRCSCDTLVSITDISGNFSDHTASHSTLPSRNTSP